MSHHASFIPPNVEPPEPPEAKMVALVFSIFMSVVLVALIGFVGVEFVADMIGHPLNFEARQPLLDPLLPTDETLIVFKSPVELITPRHQTRTRSPEGVVIYTVRSTDSLVVPPDLVVDNVHHPWEMQYGDNTWFARIMLEPGEHRVQVAESEVDFFVVPPGSTLWSPEQWAWNFPHPGTNKVDRCDDCHEMYGTPTKFPAANHGHTIGPWKGILSCFASACHSEEDHESIHRIIQPKTNWCLRCHVMH